MNGGGDSFNSSSSQLSVETNTNYNKVRFKYKSNNCSCDNVFIFGQMFEFPAFLISSIRVSHKVIPSLSSTNFFFFYRFLLLFLFRFRILIILTKVEQFTSNPFKVHGTIPCITVAAIVDSFHWEIIQLSGTSIEHFLFGMLELHHILFRGFIIIIVLSFIFFDLFWRFILFGYTGIHLMQLNTFEQSFYHPIFGAFRNFSVFEYWNCLLHIFTLATST